MPERLPPAFVISLDFELHWGVRDFRPLDAAERSRLLAARRVIPQLLYLFEEFGIHATWATVGILFAESKSHLEKFKPRLRPAYRRSELDPYAEEIGANEAEDPFHFAPSLIAEIARHPGQEIATHSFSHYYCLEVGQSLSEFEADLQSAVAIAADRGYSIQSYVFPRNQAELAYLPAVKSAGLTCYRDAEPASVNEPRDFYTQRRFHYRAARLADSYLSLFGPKTQSWPTGQDFVSITGSRYLSPYRGWLAPFESLRLKRIVSAMKHAAATGEIFHLWWHPEDFARHSGTNLAFLRSVLLAFDQLRREYPIRSLSMAEAASMVHSSAEALLQEKV